MAGDSCFSETRFLVQVPTSLTASSRSIYKLNAHIVLVVYRRKAIDAEILKKLREIITDTLKKWDCEFVSLLPLDSPIRTNSPFWKTYQDSLQRRKTNLTSLLPK
ncbi:transposase [Nostoc flagelliforme]|uniref:transposase n=1 Tax=Nostoc flagelliforme TaxID=1306274 RepID=UPI003BAEE1F3